MARSTGTPKNRGRRQDDPRHDHRGEHRRLSAGDPGRGRDVDRAVDPMGDDLRPYIGQPERDHRDEQREPDQLDASGHPATGPPGAS